MIKFRRLRCSGLVAKMEEGRSTFKSLTGSPTGNIPLRRLRRRWEDNIRVNRKEVPYISIRGIGLIRLRVGIIGEPL